MVAVNYKDNEITRVDSIYRTDKVKEDGTVMYIINGVSGKNDTVQLHETTSETYHKYAWGTIHSQVEQKMVIDLRGCRQ